MVVQDDELTECTELLRGMLLIENDADISSHIADIRARAQMQLCEQRAQRAEKQVKENSWWSIYGFPIGTIVGAAIASSIAIGSRFLINK